VEAAEVHAETLCNGEKIVFGLSSVPTDTVGCFGSWNGNVLDVFRTYKKPDGYLLYGSFRTKPVCSIEVVETELSLSHDPRNASDDESLDSDDCTYNEGDE